QGMEVIDQQLGGSVTLDIILDADKSLLAQIEEPLEDDNFADDDAGSYGDDYDEDRFGSDEDHFADPGKSSSTHECYWFSLNGLDTIAKLHSYLESLPEVGKVQSLAVSYQLAQDINGGRLNNFELNVLRRMLPEEIKTFLINPYLSDEIQQTRISLRVKETT